MKKIVILLLVLCSCSPRAYDFKNGDMQGVRFKKGLSRKEEVILKTVLFIAVGVVVVVSEKDK